MGGSAFSAGPNALFTPRMPKHIYTFVKDRYLSILRDFYLCVASPIDGPGKVDFGDVDILVTWPKETTIDNQSPFEVIKHALGAVRMIAEKGNGTAANFALPWPKDLPTTDSPCDNWKASNETEDEERNRFIQVDVRICPSLEQLQWMLFKHGHGDIWNILGSIIRPYGLTVDEGALWLRVAEIEHSNRKRAKVFLSSEPQEILCFLGLPTEGFWEKPFKSLDDMYEYAAQCRMFHVLQLKYSDPDEYMKSLKSNDRRRMKYRPAFRKWVEEFIPKCREEQRYLPQPTTRDEVTAEAIERFHVEKDFITRRDEFLLERQREFIWNSIIKTTFPVPDPTETQATLYRSCLVKALKKVILEKDESYGVSPGCSLQDQRGFYVTDKVVNFIAMQHEHIGEVAFSRQHETYVEHKKKKLLSGDAEFTDTV